MAHVFDLFLWGGLFLVLLLLIVLEFVLDFVAHLLSLKRNLRLFLLDQIIKLIIILRLLPKLNPRTRIAINTIKLEPKLDIDANRSKLANNFLLNVDILEGIGVIDEG